jgi:hypothetical protein
MVFHRYGSEYFCTAVWAPGRSAGHELFVSARELMLARLIRQEQVVITATK